MQDTVLYNIQKEYFTGFFGWPISFTGPSSFLDIGQNDTETSPSVIID